MAEPQIRYDEPSDTLYITFARGERATGIELNENILLRVNKAERAAVGLTLFNYSLLVQRTEFGTRSFPLPGLSELRGDMREMALSLIQAAPVNEFLSVHAYSPGSNEVIPITSLRAERITSRAA